MPDLDFWWGLPLLISLLIGSLCPAAGSLLITQLRILLANLMAHSVLPGLVLALAFELDPSLGGLISPRLYVPNNSAMDTESKTPLMVFRLH